MTNPYRVCSDRRAEEEEDNVGRVPVLNDPPASCRSASGPASSSPLLPNTSSSCSLKSCALYVSPITCKQGEKQMTITLMMPTSKDVISLEKRGSFMNEHVVDDMGSIIRYQCRA